MEAEQLDPAAQRRRAGRRRSARRGCARRLRSSRSRSASSVGGRRSRRARRPASRRGAARRTSACGGTARRAFCVADPGRVRRQLAARRAAIDAASSAETADERASRCRARPASARTSSPVARERELRAPGRAPPRSCRARRPGCRPGRRRSSVPKRSGARRPGSRARSSREQRGRRVEQALLEEPEAVPDLVDDARPPRPHLVGLPERRDLLGERVARSGGAGRR